MAGMITGGRARFEIYEPNVYVCECVCVILYKHAYIYEGDFERVCAGRRWKGKG